MAEGDLKFENHTIKVTNEGFLKQDEVNNISFKFENTYVDNSAGLHKYIDPKDGKTYIYSHCEPFFCHRWFPCFDQPSIRATLDLTLLSPKKEWQVVANGAIKSSEALTAEHNAL